MITTNVHDKIFLLQRNFMGNTKWAVVVHPWIILDVEIPRL